MIPAISNPARSESFNPKSICMKKIIFSVFLTIFCLSTIYSQDTRFGALAGVTFASVKGKIAGQEQNTDSKVGLKLGVFANIPLSSSFSFQPQLNWAQKGGKEEQSGVTYTETYNYLEIPLYFMWMAAAAKAKEASGGGLFVGIGPAFNFAIGGKWKQEGGSQDESGDIHFGNDENNDDYKGFDIAGNLTVGYQLANGLSIATRYSHSFSNLLIDGNDDYSWKNRYWGINVGYSFGGGKSKGKGKGK